MLKFWAQSHSFWDSKELCNENKEGRNLNCPHDISGRHTYDDSLGCGEKIIRIDFVFLKPLFLVCFI